MCIKCYSSSSLHHGYASQMNMSSCMKHKLMYFFLLHIFICSHLAVQGRQEELETESGYTQTQTCSLSLFSDTLDFLPTGKVYKPWDSLEGEFFQKQILKFKFETLNKLISDMKMKAKFKESGTSHLESQLILLKCPGVGQNR